MSMVGRTLRSMDAAAWANLIAVVAIVVAVATLVWSRVDVARARAAAHEAEARAERATGAAERAVTAAEDAARAQREIADSLPKSRVDWRVEPIRDRLSRLVQVGERNAYDVEIRCDDAARFDIESDVPQPMHKGESVQYFLVPASRAPMLVVTWSDVPSGERGEWRSAA